jgi:hypothetical protein
MSEIDKCKNDLLYFAKSHVFITDPVKGTIRFEPSDKQIELLNAFHDNSYSLNVCDRQIGKSTCGAIYLLWQAMFYPDKNIAFISLNNMNAKAFLKIITDIYTRIPDPIKPNATNLNESTLTVSFENGSMIRGLSSKKIHGISGSVAYCDEFLFFGQEFFQFALSRLATRFSQNILVSSGQE